MASSGPNSPGTLADDAGIGATAWANPGNAAADDGSYAVAATAILSHYIKATNFGFSIPGGATIDGIVVEIQRFCSGGALDNAVKIVKGGSIGATDKKSGTTWPTTDDGTYQTYGTSSDLWGETWADTDINASTFGVVMAAKRDVAVGTRTYNCDHIRITVYYTAAAATGGPHNLVDSGLVNLGLIDGGLTNG